jgi:WD40 repeat protein
MAKQRLPERNTLAKIFCLIVVLGDANSVPAQNPVGPSKSSNNQAKAKQETEKRKRFVECFPENVRKYLATFEQGIAFDEEDKDLGKKLAQEVGDGETLAVCLCRAFGTLEGHEASWTGTTDKERRALSAAHTVKEEDILSALGKVKDDRRASLGAARLYFREGWREKLPSDVRPEWTVRLAEIVLQDDWDDNKDILMEHLRREDCPPVRSLLKKIMHGQIGKQSERSTTWHDEPGIRAAAAVMLVRLGEPGIKKEIEEALEKVNAKQDKAAMEVCLALLGDPSYIRKEHFELKSYTIGFGALEAIEKFKGKHGVEALAGGGIHHPWAAVNERAVYLFQKITGKKWNAEQIESWWESGAEGKNPHPTMTNAGLIRTFGKEKFGSPDSAFSSDGRKLALTEELDVAIWDVATGKKGVVLKAKEKPLIPFFFSPDGKLLAAWEEGTATIWDITSGKTLHAFQSSEKKWPLPYPPTKGFASCGVEENHVYVRELGSGKQMLSLDLPEKDIQIVGIDLASKMVAFSKSKMAPFSKNEGSLSVWDAAAKKTLWTEDPIDLTAVQFSPKATYTFAKRDTETGSEGIVFQTTSGARKLSVKIESAWPEKFAFTPDEKFLFSGNSKGKVQIWDLSRGKEVGSFRGHTEPVDRLSFSDDGKSLATTSWDGTVKIWDVEKLLGRNSPPPKGP